MNTTLRHETGVLFFFCWMMAVVSLTVLCDLPSFSFTAGRIQLLPGRVLFSTAQAVSSGNFSALWVNFLGNILVFVPIGFLLPLNWNVSGKKSVGLCFLLSFFIEFFQLFLSRTSDIDDLILNTLGGLFGVAFYTGFRKTGKFALWKTSASETEKP